MLSYVTAMTVPYKFVWDGTRSVRQHRLLMERKLGRELSRREWVHHKNEDKRDNRIDNLQVMDAGDHLRHHRQKYPTTFTCVPCGAKFQPHPGHRYRNPRHCSKRCFGVARRVYSDELLRSILERQLHGEPLNAILKEVGISRGSFFQAKRRLLNQT
jgi:hypothetical protein